MAALLWLAGLLWLHAGPGLVAREHDLLAVQARVHGRALGHSLGGGSVIQCYSVLLGQAMGVYLDVLLLSIIGLLSELVELSVGHVVVHGTCMARQISSCSGIGRGGDLPSTRGRLLGEGAFSLELGDGARWPFMSICEPSRCICAAIMLGLFIWPMLAMGLPLLVQVSGGQGRQAGGAGVRAVVLESGALEVVLGDAVGDVGAHHADVLVLGVHGVVHHHALVALLVLHLGEGLGEGG